MKANCKYCGKELTVTLDPNYDAVNDPSGLLTRQACKKCTEFKKNTPDLFYEWLRKKRSERPAPVYNQPHND